MALAASQTGYYVHAVACNVTALQDDDGNPPEAEGKRGCVTSHKCAGDSAEDICNPLAKYPVQVPHPARRLHPPMSLTGPR